ncbi:MAG TPA: hypothetical protein PKW35_07965, partial [Nannocystaceae bacterium]|nr:hypothetical protein [Nannocystaceae bacterium]
APRRVLLADVGTGAGLTLLAGIFYGVLYHRLDTQTGKTPVIPQTAVDDYRTSLPVTAATLGFGLALAASASVSLITQHSARPRPRGAPPSLSASATRGLIGFSIRGAF